MTVYEFMPFMHFPTQIQHACAWPDVASTILKFLSFLYPLKSTFDSFHFTVKFLLHLSHIKISCWLPKWKLSSRFEYKIIFVRLIKMTPPVACYIAPKMRFVEPFVICPKSSMIFKWLWCFRVHRTLISIYTKLLALRSSEEINFLISFKLS